MNRRQFFGLAASSIFVPVYGKWYRQGSGLLVAQKGAVTFEAIAPATINAVLVTDGRGSTHWEPVEPITLAGGDLLEMTWTNGLPPEFPLRGPGAVWLSGWQRP